MKRDASQRRRRDRITIAIKNNYQMFPNYDMLKEIVQYRYCKKCKGLKPPRTHHCSVCGKCVLRMDHHCPWVGSCVSIKTHKMFLLFMVYSVMSACYALSTMGKFREVV